MKSNTTDSCTQKRKERVPVYDFLRAFGILCIIFAHTDPCQLLFQIRNFDVPLMVVLSGISFAIFSEKGYNGYLAYVRSRFNRLILPTWIFLLIYYIFLFSINRYVSFDIMVKSFFLLDGCGWGIWIIRVFWVVSLCAPAVRHFNKIVSNDYVYFAILFLVIMVFTLFLFHYDGTGFVYQYILLCSPYVVVFCYGVRISRYSRNTLLIHAVFFLIVCMVGVIYLYLINGSLVATQGYKYPPTMYYLSYALFISALLLALASKVPVKIQESFIVSSIASSSLWFYFWHWIVLFVVARFLGGQNFLIRYFFVVTITFFVVLLQRKSVDFILKNFCPQFCWCRKFFVC